MSAPPVGSEPANLSAGMIGGESHAASLATTIAPEALCTDRPTKSNYACTVDAGHFQYEADLMNGSYQRLYGRWLETYLVANSTFKYGFIPHLDLELGFSPIEVGETHTHSGKNNVLVGMSDIVIRAKYEFFTTRAGDLQVAILPFLKAPTARLFLGNGAVEGGTIIPVNYKLNAMLTLTFDPEIDVYKNSLNTGRHFNTAQVINLGVGLPHDVTAYVELWEDWNFDPAGTVRQSSADLAVAWGITKLVQLDAGLNFGLDRATPSLQLYVGLSEKI